MKTKWVATPNARKFKAIPPYNWGSVLLISVFLMLISCNNDDDLETIVVETPGETESLIVYTDIEPDFNSQDGTDSYDLDLNNDLIVDFILKSDSDEYEDWFEIREPNGIGNGSISVSPYFTHPLPLDGDSKIYDLAGYRNDESYEPWGIFVVGECIGGESDCIENWKDNGESYLGLKFDINGKQHYGWARLDVTSAFQWVIKDYAYNATPNSPILAGQKE